MSKTEGEDQCPTTCRRASTKITVTCGNAGLKFIPPDLPGHLLVSDLSHNMMALLSQNSLNTVTKMLYFILENYTVTSIEPTAFSNFANLTILLL